MFDALCTVNWLDVTRSLNSQGIEDGDMVWLRYRVSHSSCLLLCSRCRKKFFIFNEDVREAEKNDLLRKMIYSQVRHSYIMKGIDIMFK